MIRYVRNHLGIKLFLSYLAIILVGGAVLAAISQSILPASFNRHMARLGTMDSDQGPRQGMGMDGGGMGRGGLGGAGGSGGTGTMAQLYADYRASFNDALLYASLAAAVAAVVLSFGFSRGVIAPVRDMALASQRIADGHYEERVRVSGSDELAGFSVRFNQMAEKLEQVEAMRRRLIGDVSHELRTPLTTIKGSLEGLIDGVLPATPQTYEQIHVEADRLNRLVDDLQELSSVEARAHELHFRPVDVASLLENAAMRLALQAKSRNIALILDPAADLPPVQADEDRLLQVLTNLISNAVQYSLDGGQVTVTAQHQDGEVRISVIDTGIGISSEHLPLIFDRFYRIDPSRSRRAGGGSGIGLTIARALVEAHGGRIWVESGGEGQGSTFSFALHVANSKAGG
jgi:two-component system sensor histidine kinase BaeS